ncbi:hypothetical protein FOL47_007034 [Perkinsus chesapeaki]|uniref:Uncharacterized protein n=1 Tax=Perkinsus chesapeaki TaxID=330153 RepID=A0A7J6LNQ9_PERCH|nr:hypothetical protein FOL47_007034 [Perkinsus chesapeaki]
MAFFGIVVLCLTYCCSADFPSGTYVGQIANPYLRVVCSFYRPPKPFVIINVTCNRAIPYSPLTTVDIVEVPGKTPKEFSVKPDTKNIGRMKELTDRLNGMCPGRGFSAGDFVVYTEVNSGFAYDVDVKKTKMRLYLRV